MTTRRVKVVFAIPTMDVVGAQRVLTFILKGLDRSRVEPVLLLHTRTGKFLKEVPRDVPIHVVHSRLDSWVPSHARLLTYARGYRRELLAIKPDVVIGVSEYPSMMMAHVLKEFPYQVQLVACEHVFMSRAIKDPTNYDLSFRLYFERNFQRIYNRQCRFVTTVTSEAAEDLRDNWKIAGDKIRVIPNLIDADAVQTEGRHPVDHPWLQGDRPVIMGVGRLVEQKRFDRLIEAFAKISDKRAVLMIVGFGHLEQALRAQASRMGVADRFQILPRTPPYDYLARANMLVLTSEWEGFGMVILEAMVLGVPVVSLACPAGPRDLLDNGRLGTLVDENDPQALCSAISEGINNGGDILRKAADAKRETLRYSIPSVCRMYEDLILEAVEAVPPAERR